MAPMPAQNQQALVLKPSQAQTVTDDRSSQILVPMPTRKQIQPSTLSQSQTALGMLREQTWSKADLPQKRCNNHARKDGIKYIKRDSIKVVQKGGMKLVKRGAISLNMVRDSLSIVLDDKAPMPPNEQNRLKTENIIPVPMEQIQVPMSQSKHIIPVQIESDEIETTDEALITENDDEKAGAQKAAAKKDFKD